MDDLVENINLIPWVNKRFHQETIISTTFEFHRNLDKFNFFNKCDQSDRKEIRDTLLNKLQDILSDFTYLKSSDIAEEEFNIIKERQIVPHNIESQEDLDALFIKKEYNNRFAYLINFTDHLTGYFTFPGYNILENYHQIKEMQNEIDQAFDFAYSEKYGFLNSAPNDLGRGFHIQLLSHVPALLITESSDQLNRLEPVTKVKGTGFFDEETVIGDLVKFITQESMGLEDIDIVTNAINLAEQLRDVEKERKDFLFQASGEKVQKEIRKAIDSISKERSISLPDSMMLVSTLRLASLADIVDLDSVHLTRLFYLIQPFHLKSISETEDEIESVDQERLRFIKLYLQNLGWNGFGADEWE